MFSVNDIVKVGKSKFDIQTEVRGNKIVGEIFFQGKIVKRMEKEVNKDEITHQTVFSFHEALKESLIRSLLKVAGSEKKTQIGKSKIDLVTLKKKLEEFLELDEKQIKWFGCQIKERNLNVYFDENYKNFKPEEIVDMMQAVMEEQRFLKKYVPLLRSFYFIFKMKGKVHLLIFLRQKDDSTFAALLNPTSLGMIRRKFKDIGEFFNEFWGK